MQGIIIEDPQGEFAHIYYFNFSSFLSTSSDPTSMNFIPCLEIDPLLGKWHSSLKEGNLLLGIQMSSPI